MGASTTKGKTSRMVNGKGKSQTSRAAGARNYGAKNSQVKMGTKSSGGAKTGKC